MWNLLPYLPMLLGAGMSAFGQQMKQGDPLAEADKNMAWLGKAVPGLANSNYSAMMGGPMGRSLRMSALGAGRSFNSGMRGAIGAAGGFNGGIGQVAAGLGKTGYWDALSKGQGALGQMAWSGAQDMGLGALGAGAARANAQDQYRRSIMGAGLGTIGQGMNDLARPKFNMFRGLLHVG